MDCSAWIERAKKFVGELNFPNHSGIEIDIHPSLSSDDAVALDKSLPLGLPTPLRDFYTTGSASLSCWIIFSMLTRASDFVKLSDLLGMPQTRLGSCASSCTEKRLGDSKKSRRLSALLVPLSPE